MGVLFSVLLCACQSSKGGTEIDGGTSKRDVLQVDELGSSVDTVVVSDTNGGADSTTDTSTSPQCNADEVLQPGTKLCWKRCAEGFSWTNSTCAFAAYPQAFVWQSASVRCPSPHRIPTLQEYEALFKVTTCANFGSGYECGPCKDNPTCNSMFPGSTGTYWTGSQLDSAEAWSADFARGRLMPDDVTQSLPVLCVRELP